MIDGVELEFSVRLRAAATDVWAAASTMPGVNDELLPIIRMTYPRAAGSLTSDAVTTGSVLFRSWVLLGGIVPIDRHALVLERVIDGVGFDEESTTWLQRRWRHERRIVPATDGGCTVIDRLTVVPRVRRVDRLVRVIVRGVFRHRHRRLVRRFGAG